MWEMPKICIPVMGETMNEIKKEVQAAVEKKPDLIEWRADGWEQGKDPAAVTEALREIQKEAGGIPLIFTFRSKSEGGKQEISYKSYRELLRQVGRTGIPELIDVEVFFSQLENKTLIRELQEKNCKVIGSCHDFEKTPSEKEMEEILTEEDRAGADVLKLAVMPQKPEDVFRLLSCTMKMKQKTEKPLITMSMGKKGCLSRICGELTGSAISFAAGLQSSAPGQLPAEELREVLEVLHKAVQDNSEK